MIIENNRRKTIMIHSYRSNYFLGDENSILNLDDLLTKDLEFKPRIKEILKDYIITFDDGLIQQYDIFKLFDFIDRRNIIFFPSFGLLRPNNIQPNPIENSIAHSNKTLYLSTFMSSVEVWDSMQQGIKLGAHGWYHLNLNLNYTDIDTTQLNQDKITLITIKDDSKKCAHAYFNYIKPFIDEYIIDGCLEFYFCTPYNIYNEKQKIYINYFARTLNLLLKKSNIDIPSKLKIFSGERIPIENILNGFYS